MTNKYSELSDLEIDHLIAESRNGRKIDRGIGRDIFVPKICTHYHDAMQLMIDNEISLTHIPLNNKWEAVGKFGMKMDGSGSCNYSLHENPCRAIAECYLLMKEEENNNGK